MNIISRCQNSKIRLLSESPLELLYSKLRAKLGPELITFFSRPAVRNNETIWSVDTQDSLKSASDLDQETRAYVADILNVRKMEILDIIRNDSELSGISDKLFIIPSDEEIFCYKDRNNNLAVVLAQWACSRLDFVGTPDPVSFFVSRALSDRISVKLRVRYRNGSEASSYPFVFEYDDVRRNLDTDAAGCRFLGTLKTSSQFLITLTCSDETISKIFTVTGSEEYYDIVLRRESSVIVFAVDEEGKPVNELILEYEFDGTHGKVLTNIDGKAVISELEAWKKIIFPASGSVIREVSAVLEPDENIIRITVGTKRQGYLRVVTVTADGTIIPDQKIYLELPGTGVSDRRTDQSGEFVSESLGVGDKVSVSLSEAGLHQGIHEIEQGENLIRLVVNPALSPAQVQVKLIDHKNNPIPSADIGFAARKNNFTGVTDKNGIISTSETSFEEGERVRLQIDKISVGRKKRWGSGDKIQKYFDYNSKQNDYVIRLGRQWNFWWILLLLPLLLLIRCEKDVRVLVVHADNKTPVAGMPVNFGYNRAFLLDRGRLFPSEWISSDSTTDKNGTATFRSVEFSLYSWVVYNLSESKTFVHSTCVASDTISSLFNYHSGSDIIRIRVNPVTVETDFRVLDSSDGQPLPGSLVCVTSEFNGLISSDTSLTNADGRVVFGKIPKCGKILRVTGALDGYLPDSLRESTVESLLAEKPENGRTLKLKPITDKIVFFIRNCRNNQPLPDAVATITLEYDNGLKKSQKINTNVNGVGKGNYDEAHVIAQAGISAEKKYFKSGGLGKKYKVSDFVRLPDTLRTFCLEPEANSFDFVDIDAKTGKPITGVSNIVTVTNGGKDSRKDTLISNGNGVFTVGSVFSGDVVSIHASKLPEYTDNDYTIRNRDGIGLLEGPASDRVIPLNPREVDLKFRTLDAESGALLSDADLIVTVDGLRVATPSGSGTGEFTIKVPYTSAVSIVADKVNYEKNDIKINNKSVGYLFGADQIERDIPLKRLPKARFEITIYNFNKAKDEIFDVLVNGVNVGKVAHTVNLDTRTAFDVMMEVEGDNIVELVIEKESMAAVNAGTALIIEPGGYQIRFNGDDTSYRFRFNAETKTLTGPETF